MSSIESEPYIHPPLPVLMERNETAIENSANLFSSQKENPYIRSPHFEVVSPIGEDCRRELIHDANTHEDVYRSIWRSSKNLNYITENEASHRALDRVYSGPIREIEETEGGYELADMFLSNLHTSMAARNRFRIVQKVYNQEIADHFSLNGHSGVMNTLSIAAGSSRAIMETMAEASPQNMARMNVRLVDNSTNAISDGKDLSQKLGIQDSVDLRQVNFLRFNRYLDEGYSPRFTEIVGLFDYVPNKLVVKMLEQLRVQMPENGSVLYSSVSPNDEQKVLHDIIGWRPMVYREGEEMRELARDAGFQENNIQVIEEPLHMCNLILARK